MRRLTVDSRMLGAGLLAAVAAATVLIVTQPPDSTAVLVAARPAAAGTRLSAVEVHQRTVQDPTGLVPVSGADDLMDHVLLIDVEPDAPLVAASLASPEAAAASDVIGLELPLAAAVHAVLVPGDEVDVYLASEPTEPLATGVTVVDVFADRGSLGVGDVGVLLAVDDSLAPALVRAISDDSIHLVRSGG